MSGCDLAILNEAMFHARAAKAAGFSSLRIDVDHAIEMLDAAQRMDAVERAMRDAGEDPSDPCAVIEAMAQTVKGLSDTISSMIDALDGAEAKSHGCLAMIADGDLPQRYKDEMARRKAADRRVEDLEMSISTYQDQTRSYNDSLRKAEEEISDLQDRIKRAESERDAARSRIGMTKETTNALREEGFVIAHRSAVRGASLYAAAYEAAKLLRDLGHMSASNLPKARKVLEQALADADSVTGAFDDTKGPPCACPFGRVIDGKIGADERAGTYHVWRYLAQHLAQHLVAIVGIDVVKMAHGCGEDSERNRWIDEMGSSDTVRAYASSPWCMPLASAQLLAVGSALSGDDKGESRDHPRWTPTLDRARALVRDLRNALEVDGEFPWRDSHRWRELLQALRDRGAEITDAAEPSDILMLIDDRDPAEHNDRVPMPRQTHGEYVALGATSQGCYRIYSWMGRESWQYIETHDGYESRPKALDAVDAHRDAMKAAAVSPTVPSHGELVRESFGNRTRRVYVCGEGWVSQDRVLKLADGIRSGDPYPWAAVTEHGGLVDAPASPRDESVPPPGWHWYQFRDGSTNDVCVARNGTTSPGFTLAYAWDRYNAEHGHAPASPPATPATSPEGGPSPECEGWSARWCPMCGDCKCSEEQWERGVYERTCALHGCDSQHAREAAPAPSEPCRSALSSNDSDTEQVAAALGDARLAGGLSPDYYHVANEALTRIHARLVRGATVDHGQETPSERCEEHGGPMRTCLDKRHYQPVLCFCGEQATQVVGSRANPTQALRCDEHARSWKRARTLTPVAPSESAIIDGKTGEEWRARCSHLRSGIDRAAQALCDRDLPHESKIDAAIDALDDAVCRSATSAEMTRKFTRHGIASWIRKHGERDRIGLSRAMANKLAHLIEQGSYHHDPCRVAGDGMHDPGLSPTGVSCTKCGLNLSCDIIPEKST